MFPPGSPSTQYVQADFLSPDEVIRDPLIDYERGGIHLNDASQGLDVQDWKAWYDGTSIKVSTVTNTDVTTVVTAALVTYVSLAFDQNMRLALVYVANGITKLRWFDPVANAIVTDTIDNANQPMISLDDKREISVSTSDLVLVYIRGDVVYFRLQRERFIIENTYATLNPGIHTVLGMGLNRQNRFQIYIRTVFE